MFNGLDRFARRDATRRDVWWLRCTLQKESFKRAKPFGVKTFGFIYNAETRFTMMMD